VVNIFEKKNPAEVQNVCLVLRPSDNDVDTVFVFWVFFSAVMRLSNELIYGGALQCANDDVARATILTSADQKQVCRLG